MSSASYRSTVLAIKPSWYWPLQETSGSVAADVSGNNLNGTYVNISAYAQPRKFADGKSIYLNNQSGYGETRVYTPVVGQPPNYSISFLFNAGTSAASNGGCLVSRTGTANGNASYYYDSRFVINSSGIITLDGNVSSSPNVCDGKWHHLAITSASNQTMVVYLDNTIILNTTYSLQVFSGLFTFGAEAGNAIATFGGYIAEVAGWTNYTMTAADVANQYQSTLQTTTTTTTTTTTQTPVQSTTTTTQTPAQSTTTTMQTPAQSTTTTQTPATSTNVNSSSITAISVSVGVAVIVAAAATFYFLRKRKLT